MTVRELADLVVAVRDTDAGPRVELTARSGQVLLGLPPAEAAVAGAWLATTAARAGHPAPGAPQPGHEPGG